MSQDQMGRLPWRKTRIPTPQTCQEGSCWRRVLSMGCGVWSYWPRGKIRDGDWIKNLECQTSKCNFREGRLKFLTYQKVSLSLSPFGRNGFFEVISKYFNSYNYYFDLWLSNFGRISILGCYGGGFAGRMLSCLERVCQPIPHPRYIHRIIVGMIWSKRTMFLCRCVYLLII